VLVDVVHQLAEEVAEGRGDCGWRSAP
jgi:hypothetical protein